MKFENRIYPKNLYVFLLAALIISCGIYFRMYPAIQNINKINTELYKQLIHTSILNNLKSQIDTAYPTMPAAMKVQAVNRQIANIYRDEPGKVNKLIDDMKKNSVKTPFEFNLLGADSYYYLYLTKKIIMTGSISSEIKDGKYFDPYMNAPNGNWRVFEVHPYLGAVLYKAVSIFNRNADMVKVLASLPLLLFVVSMILFYLLCADLKISRFSSFLSSVFLALSPIYLLRSSCGWYDTDPYNVIFTLSALILLFHVLTPGKRRFITIFFLGLLSSIYSVFWQGWILIPAMITISFFVLLLRDVLNKRSLKDNLTNIAVYLAVMSIGGIVFLSPKGFILSLKDIGNIFAGFLFLKSNPWPDIFLTVGELKNTTYAKISDLLGIPVFLPCAILGIIFIFLKKTLIISRDKSTVIIVFFLLLLILSKNAQRFIIFLLPVAAVSFAVFLDKIVFIAANMPLKPLREHGQATKRTLCVILALLLIFPLRNAHTSSLSNNPLFNQAWERSLTKIRDNTPKNSIINSWWPPGHFIKAIADRGTPFDGATMNTPQAYWMSLFFLSTSEKEAIAILRMLDLSGNKATEFLLENDIPIDKSIEIIKKIIVMDKNDSLKFLVSYISKENAMKLLQMTHGTPGPSYCYIYNELVENVLGLYYVQNWDFTKSLDFGEKRKKNFKKSNIFWRGSKDNISSIWSISGGMPYVGKISPRVEETEKSIKFQNGVILDKKTKMVWLDNLENKVTGIPQSIVYADKDGRPIYKDLKNSSIKLSVLFLGKTDRPDSCIVAPPKVTSSILFRLYYFGSKGLKHFEFLTEETMPFINTRILVYKVKWDAE